MVERATTTSALKLISSEWPELHHMSSVTVPGVVCPSLQDNFCRTFGPQRMHQRRIGIAGKTAGKSIKPILATV